MSFAPADDFTAVAERMFPGALLRGARRLTGGVSADVHALELEGRDGQRRTIVVRRHGAAEPKPRYVQAMTMEYELLQALHGMSLPVPEPLFLDTTNQLFPGPYQVIEFVEGSTDVAPDELDDRLDVMAATLARLHRLPTDNLPALPLRIDPLPEALDFLPEAPEWHTLREHLSRQTDTEYRDRPVLLHGDFWTGNLLWRQGRLVAILDWEDAALGDPASDVAGSRLELLWKFGPAAMERFTRSYAREHPLDPGRLPLWEVYVGAAAARYMGAWGLGPAREKAMRRAAYGFVRRAGISLMAESRG